MKKENRGQEEIVGFALIVIVVAVILLVILSFLLGSRGKESVESYEVGSFIQAFLQYTSDCNNGLEYLPVQKLIFSCGKEETCDDERNACDVLENTLRGIVEKSWKVGEETPVKGYKVRIVSIGRHEVEEDGGEEILLIEQGEETKNYESSMQTFSKSGTDYEIRFSAYY